LADQRRSYYCTQLRTCRNWFPLFFWLLDTAVINAFLLSQEYLSSLSNTEPHERYWAHHGMFRTRLAWNLVLEGFRLLNSDYEFQIRTMINPNPSLSSSLPVGNGRYCLGAIPKGNNTHSRHRGYVSKNYELNPRRKFPGPHAIEHGRQKLCLFCRYLAQHPELYPSQPSSSSPARQPHSNLAFQGPPIGAPSPGKIRHTSFQCSTCKEPLCVSYCMRAYHERDF